MQKNAKPPTASEREQRRQLEPELAGREPRQAEARRPRPATAAGRPPTSATADRDACERPPAGPVAPARRSTRATGRGARDRGAAVGARRCAATTATTVPSANSPRGRCRELVERAARRRSRASRTSPPKRPRRARRRAGSGGTASATRRRGTARSARTKPMKRPTRIVVPPRRSKKSSTCASRSSVIFTRAPWRTQEAAAEPAAERVRRHVAGDRARPHDRDQQEHVDLALAGDEAAEEDRRLARARRSRGTRRSPGRPARRRAGRSRARASSPRSSSSFSRLGSWIDARRR